MEYRDIASSSNGGPRLRVALCRWITNRGEHSNLVIRSFIASLMRLSYTGDDVNEIDIVSFSKYLFLIFTLYVMIFYFSGTGNSKWVATKIAAALGDRIIDIADKNTLCCSYQPSDSEKIGIVFPVYAWGPPEIVVKFIRSVNISSPKYIYFVCTCGDETGYTPSILKREISARSWKCSAGFSIMMPNTYVSLPGFDIDDEAIEKNKVMGAAARLEHICGKLQENIVMSSFECHIGPLPFLKSGIIYPLFNKYALSAKPYNVNHDICISCGKCQKACPVGNVKLVDKYPVWGDNCTQCLACYHSCPTHAINYGKMTQKKGQYKGKYLL